MPIDVNPMRQYQWNVSYQRQLPGRMLFDVTYTGNKTDHIWVPGYAENPRSTSPETVRRVSTR